ncbi:amino acid ABC transporter permease [Nocardia sp. CA2R105]|uniref:amino acid ABC transporter permease n=1 Tax=Nocardia coffeae TaxID=2873381 RepID=UPI001CA78DA8|nr:amino acid ABC transporter permease [Nocardia coffeae]MBY8863788.1 amino acid ABC transporter permease [Nocardia coffeae]
MKSSATTPIQELARPVEIVRKKHYGRYVTGAVLVVIAALLIRAFANADIGYGITAEYFTQPFVIYGVLNTVILSVTAMAIGLVLGVLAALARLSANPVLKGVASTYIWLFRGTPVLVQLLLWYNMSLIFPTIYVPFLGEYTTNSIMTPFVAALIGLGVNEGAYMGEIIRGGILSVDNGQRQAAKALGMSPFQVTTRIVLPQAFRVCLPGTGNQFVIMLKSSSLASIVQYSELLNKAETVYQRNLAIIELLLVASLWYIILTTIFTFGQSLLERRAGRSQLTTARQRRFFRRNLAGA